MKEWKATKQKGHSHGYIEIDGVTAGIVNSFEKAETLCKAVNHHDSLVAELRLASRWVGNIKSQQRMEALLTRIERGE